MSSRIRGHRRRDAARSRPALYGPQQLALNILILPERPYGHFVDHEATLRRCLEQDLEIAKPERLRWARHRYINQVTVAPDEDPAALITLYPSLPPAHSKSHPGVNVQVESARFPGGVVEANLGLAFKNPDRCLYVLDVYARSEGALSTSSIAELLDWHRRAHEHVVATFLFAITATGRARFKERPA